MTIDNDLDIMEPGLLVYVRKSIPGTLLRTTVEELKELATHDDWRWDEKGEKVVYTGDELDVEDVLIPYLQSLSSELPSLIFECLVMYRLRGAAICKIHVINGKVLPKGSVTDVVEQQVYCSESSNSYPDMFTVIEKILTSDRAAREVFVEYRVQYKLLGLA